jgi:hypothetical protein
LTGVSEVLTASIIRTTVIFINYKQLFENIGLRKVFRPKKDKVSKQFRILGLQSGGFCDLLRFLAIVMTDEMGNAYRILLGKPLEKWSLGRLKDIIKMDLRKIGCQNGA